MFDEKVYYIFEKQEKRYCENKLFNDTLFDIK